MNAKTIISTLACLVLGSAVATTGCGQKKPSGNVKAAKTAREVVERNKSRASQLASKITKLEIDNSRLTDQRDAARAKAQMARLKPLNGPEDIIEELPDLYVSNDKAFQRRRIHLTESLVDHGEDSLSAIDKFLSSSQDTEPDIDADSHRRMLDRYGITEEQYVSLKNSIKETLEVMKPALDADKESRDAESAKRRDEARKRYEEGEPARAERRAEEEKRRTESRARRDEFSATLEGLSDDERRQKVREWEQQQRELPENVARRGEERARWEQYSKDREARREQERKDREARGPSETDKLRAAVEGNAKVVIGAEQFEAMKNDRSLDRLIREIGGSDYRNAAGGGGREDWRSRLGGGRGGDQGRGGRPGGGR